MHLTHQHFDAFLPRGADCVNGPSDRSAVSLTVDGGQGNREQPCCLSRLLREELKKPVRKWGDPAGLPRRVCHFEQPASQRLRCARLHISRVTCLVNAEQAHATARQKRRVIAASTGVSGGVQDQKMNRRCVDVVIAVRTPSAQVDKMMPPICFRLVQRQMASVFGSTRCSTFGAALSTPSVPVTHSIATQRRSIVFKASKGSNQYDLSVASAKSKPSSKGSQASKGGKKRDYTKHQGPHRLRKHEKEALKAVRNDGSRLAKA